MTNMNIFTSYTKYFMWMIRHMLIDCFLWLKFAFSVNYPWLWSENYEYVENHSLEEPHKESSAFFFNFQIFVFFTFFFLFFFSRAFSKSPLSVKVGKKSHSVSVKWHTNLPTSIISSKNMTCFRSQSKLEVAIVSFFFDIMHYVNGSISDTKAFDQT